MAGKKKSELEANLLRAQSRVERRRRIFSNPESVTEDDYVWLGRDGDLKIDALAAERGSAEAILSAVLLEIIEHHAPDPKGRSPEARLASALNALIGVTAPRGAKERLRDDEILLSVAHEVLKSELGFADGAKPMTELIRAQLENVGEAGVSDDRIRSLREKFEEHRDRYLYRASARTEEPGRSVAFREIVGALRRAGVL